jgi:UDP-3-O-acyl-N-acetylglucosamine deacetylase
MKKLTIVLSAVLFMFLFACGGSSEEKEDAKQEETKKETKKLSKSTKEGMMAILDEANINVSDQLTYEKVDRKSNSYVISFKNDSVNEETAKELAKWFENEVNKLAEAGWKKVPIRENEEMMGIVFNEVILYPPDKEDVDITYGLTLSSTYTSENKTYSFYCSVD